jgi:iron complex transport system substrate-binding protein
MFGAGSMNYYGKASSVFLAVASVILLVPAAWTETLGAAAPKRVVSLAPSVTETIFALGFGDRLVGVTTFCDYPAEARKLPKIGSFINASLEAVVAQRPDIVIGVDDANQSVKAREMRQLGLKVSLVSMNSVIEILKSVKSIAEWMGDAPEGEKLVRKMAGKT